MRDISDQFMAEKPMRTRAAFTLPELIIAVTVSSLLVVSLGAALSIATRSLRPDDSSAVTLDSARGLRMLQEDIRFSSRVLNRTSRSIRLITTDADKDGSRDLVEYSWSGVAGESLLRSVNGGSAVSICSEVTDFQIQLMTQGETQTIAAPPEAGEEVLLDQNTSSSNASWQTAGSVSFGQWIHPPSFSSRSLDSSEEWQLTRLDYFVAKAFSWGGSSYRLEIDRATEDGLPTHESLFDGVFDSNAPSLWGSWQSVSLASAQWLDATQGVSFRLRYHSGYEQLRVPIASDEPLHGYLVTDESTSEWLRPATNRSLLYRAYGRVRTKSHVDQQQPSRRFHMADLRIATATAGDGFMYAAAEFLNKPLDAELVAETDFAARSISDDSNFDGSSDWSLINTSTTNSSSVSSGLWTATNRALRSSTEIADGRHVDIMVRCRDTSTASGGPLIRCAVRQPSGGQSVSAAVHLTLQSNGTQTLAVYEETATNTLELRAQYSMLGSGLQSIRLTLQPQDQTAAVWVNDVFLESHRLATIAAPGLPSRVQIQAMGSSGEFDDCRILLRTHDSGDGVLP